jgi:hypothetical protein
MNSTVARQAWRDSPPQTPTQDQIRRAAAAIRQQWGPAKRRQRQQLAGYLQRRLLRVALQSAA